MYSYTVHGRVYPHQESSLGPDDSNVPAFYTEKKIKFKNLLYVYLLQMTFYLTTSACKADINKNLL